MRQNLKALEKPDEEEVPETKKSQFSPNSEQLKKQQHLMKQSQSNQSFRPEDNES